MLTATLQEAKAKLHQLVEKARSGETVVLMRGSEIVAEIRPLSAADLEIAPRLSDQQAERFWKETEEKGSPAEKKDQRRRELVTGLEKMLPVIIQKYQPEKIILFGSLATGRVHEGSDLDLVVIKKTKRRPLERRRELIHLAQPTVAVDFFVYTPEEFEKGRREGKAVFLKEIERDGKVLYEKAA